MLSHPIQGWLGWISGPMQDDVKLALHHWTVEPGENGSPSMSSLGLVSGVRIGDVLALGLQVQGVLQRFDTREVNELKKILYRPLEGYGLASETFSDLEFEFDTSCEFFFGFWPGSVSDRSGSGFRSDRDLSPGLRSRICAVFG